MDSEKVVTEKVWSLLRLKADSDEELKEKYRQVYIDEYVMQEIYDWMGNRIFFAKHQFYHAFSESSDYRNSFGEHDIPFSKRRARHILWIKKALMVAPSKISYTVECRSEMRRKTRNRRQTNVVTRTYTVIEERYVVVLDKKDNKYHFVTAIPASASYIKSIIKKSALIRSKKYVCEKS
jgi:hypothetical protein